ncbi:acyl-CoA thioesterase [Carnobacterium antarcticum]|uniref:Acyl-CoA thioesterase n=1 Tax=Carnobacterium antarcticum TaxID=2126436 RepID=A0ABW4NM03_9LACT|nr:acyl-CoA thioesterase [Carnobacterium sp. CP1]ALV21964.1 4-hydroxybenzoyl-CoA thioesterase family active site [Carnobacterium sp. CP1]
MKKNLSQYEHKAQYYETYQMGIIHHSNYIRWFEEARTSLLDEVGFGYDQMEKEGIIVPVLAISCDYTSMVRYNQTVLILPKVETFNGIRMTISYQITDKATGELKAAGKSNHCFLDKDYRPISLKKANKKIYDLFEELIGKDLG